MEPDERYAGNRVQGLRFLLPQVERVTEVRASQAVPFRVEEWLDGKVLAWLDSAEWTAEEGLGMRRVMAIAFGPDSSAWVAAGNGVSHREGSTWRTWTRQEGLDADWVGSLAVDRQGHAWAMSEKGVLELVGDRWELRFQGGSFKGGLAIDPQGRVWAGGYQRGLTMYDGERARTWELKDGLPSMNVMGVAADAGGRVWLATYGGGAICFDGTAWQTFTAHRSGLGDNHTLCVAVDRQGVPWVGADAGGVSRLDGERWTAYGRDEGFGDSSASAIAADGAGRVWAALGGWDTREREGFSVYDGETWTTGLTSDSVTAIAVDPAGDVWFGSGTGLTRLSLRNSDQAPR